jgi:hypothetical protein
MTENSEDKKTDTTETAVTVTGKTTPEVVEDKLIQISESKLRILLARNEEAEHEIKILKGSAISIMDLMGLIDKDTQTVKPEIASGEESFIPGMLKSLTEVVSLLTMAQMPKKLGGAKAEEKLAVKFAFVKELVPVINKHG